MVWRGRRRINNLRFLLNDYAVVQGFPHPPPPHFLRSKQLRLLHINNYVSSSTTTSPTGSSTPGDETRKGSPKENIKREVVCRKFVFCGVLLPHFLFSAPARPPQTVLPGRQNIRHTSSASFLVFAPARPPQKVLGIRLKFQKRTTF